MAYRQFNSQSLHDRVIIAARGYLNQKDYDIYSNPGSTKNAGIGDNYPDIIMTTKGTRTVEFIIEVETADSINLAEATNQWKKYAVEITATFYILVPANYKNVVSNLCRQVGISARLGIFQQDIYGNITKISFD